MTEQNTLTTEQEKELQYCQDMAQAYSKSNDMTDEIHSRSLAKTIFFIAYNAGQKSIEEDRNVRAREMEEIRSQRSREIGKMLLDMYENSTTPGGELRNKWFVKLVKNTADILLSHGIDLSTPKK